MGGKFEDVIIALMVTPVDFMANQLQKAMAGIGTEEETLVEILCSRNNNEVKEIVDAYERRELFLFLFSLNMDIFLLNKFY